MGPDRDRNRGIDVARDPKGKVVIQYVSLADFADALSPLARQDPTDAPPQAPPASAQSSD